VHNRRSENDELHRLDCLDFFGNNPLREAWQLAGKFVVGYSGNLSRAHDFQTVNQVSDGAKVAANSFA
jgi:hypothetical protein